MKKGGGKTRRYPTYQEEAKETPVFPIIITRKEEKKLREQNRQIRLLYSQSVCVCRLRQDGKPGGGGFCSREVVLYFICCCCCCCCSKKNPFNCVHAKQKFRDDVCPTSSGLPHGQRDPFLFSNSPMQSYIN
jgi:hypothetical protein